ncbi:tyrosine-type recombinase/integrase [Amycolatopsis aidingensis]|uniref:tyrosine-type recombinase/integrase n=1 Tax=Amycolatopsis aidingensis TaxID=2842453 RepID=UPI001C0CB938|nr:site-specific integrase [Amycolatopsis aidingensis]
MAVEDSWYAPDKATGKKVKTKRHGRGKRWRVRNRGARTVSFHKKSDAEAYDTKINGDLLKGLVPFDHKAGTETFGAYADTWNAQRDYDAESRRTVASRINSHLRPYFGVMRMRDIQPATVTAWRAWMRDRRKRNGEPYADATLTVAWVLLGSILRTAVTDGVIAKHPFDGLTGPGAPARRVRDIWEHDTVNAVLGGFSDRTRPIPLLSATCGHRQGESLAVAVEDMNPLRKEITIRHQVKRVDGKLVLAPPKRGKARTVPMPTVASDALTAHIKRHGTRTVRCTCCRKDWRVLFFDGHDLISARDFNRDAWHPAVRTAGLTPSPGTGQHQLRHYYASMLIDGGASMKEVQVFMGHASIKITADTYGHLFERSNDRARGIIDTAFSAPAYPLRTAEGQ